MNETEKPMAGVAFLVPGLFLILLIVYCIFRRKNSKNKILELNKSNSSQLGVLGKKGSSVFNKKDNKAVELFSNSSNLAISSVEEKDNRNNDKKVEFKKPIGGENLEQSIIVQNGVRSENSEIAMIKEIGPGNL